MKDPDEMIYMGININRCPNCGFEVDIDEWIIEGEECINCEGEIKNE